MASSFRVLGPWTGFCRVAIFAAGLAVATLPASGARADDGFNLNAEAFLKSLNAQPALANAKLAFAVDKNMAAPDGSSLVFFTGGDCVKGQGHTTRRGVLLTFSLTVPDACMSDSAKVAPYLHAIVATLEPTLAPKEIAPSIDALLAAAKAAPGKLTLRQIGGRLYGAAYDNEAGQTTFIPYPTIN
ncbi:MULTISPECIES: hypothetical protein [unclassified Chelatococcus]|jgi:hypothetical protein|uniref:hypothetical protein n=1 Tax=unclassified Chelatococcus TaxID=2638111 RepID=UPI001BCB002D|nr:MULTISPECIES: hypothetical protein [unclassified Chelatococcus]CAH1649944.1 conserved exported hypothetical protein [Hyphomicrobiales bacterium]MBS7739669.1 hypothetical protein [Chelatococcus sp. HY11]MBX3544038.1 hypothetical protein [Chelatococcus sp.]MCO5075794.1 hypothetical protein [Chelatococcus sp.]CAH1666795.1 conserved exported hypothetical protein [Hyphomicrobiales bacterium]